MTTASTTNTPTAAPSHVLRHPRRRAASARGCAARSTPARQARSSRSPRGCGRGHRARASRRRALVVRDPVPQRAQRVQRLVGLSARQGRAVVWKRGKSSSAAGGESVYSGVGEVVMMAWSRDRSAPGERGRNERRRHPVDQLDTGRPCDTAELTPRKAREHGASPGPSPARMRRRAASHAFY